MKLKESTGIAIRFGPFLDATDGVTPETGLSIVKADMQISKNGAAFFETVTNSAPVHDVDGWYSSSFNGNDVNTPGNLILQVTIAGAVPVWHTYEVVTALTYDTLFSNGLNSGWTETEKNELRGRQGITGTTAAGGNTPTLATATALATVDSNVDEILIDTGTTLPATLATAANLAIVDTVVDAILVDTGTTIPAQITALNDVAATDIVSAGAITTLAGAVTNVTLVATTTTNTDQRGTDSAFLAANAPANIAALNINVGGDISRVTLVDTTTTNTDMVGTNNAATAANLATVDANVDAILVDTSTTIPAQITALNDVAATDIVSNGAIVTLTGSVVSVDLVDTCTSNTDMVGTDNALLAANTPANFSSQVISGAGATDTLLQGFLNTPITETSAGRIAGNFQVFYDNANGLTTSIVDDVSSGGSGDWTTTERNQIRGRLGIVGTTAAGGNTPTLAEAADLATVDTNVDAILVDTSTTLPATLATAASLAVVDSNVDAILVDTGTTLPNTLATAANLATVDANVDAILVDTGTTIPGLIGALNDVAATDIVSGGAITTSAGAVSNVTLVATTTTNTDQRGTDNAATAANLAIVDTNVDAILVDTSTTLPNTLATAAALSTVDTNVDTILVDTTSIEVTVDAILVDTGTTLPATLLAQDVDIALIDTNVDAVLVDTSTSIPAQIAGLNDITVADILTTQLSEVYAADGVAPTITQALMLLSQNIGEFSVSGTTMTIKKLDGTTTAATYTLDDSLDPSSRTRTG